MGMAVTQADLLKGVSASAQNAPDGQKKCDYTYIRDNGAPSIGKDGNIEYRDEWKKVMESG